VILSEEGRMAGRLEGKVAVVTGSTSGIGKGIALKFAREGASIVLNGRDEEAGRKAVQEISGSGVPEERLAFFAADLMEEEACRDLIRHSTGRFGGLDVLVNNAGDFSRGDLESTTVELWDRQMALNVRAPFLLTQEAARVMRERGGGSVVNIGSVNAYIGGEDLLSYSTSKGALMTFTKNVARQLSRHNIRANVINVGWTLTEGEDEVQRAETGREDWLEEAVATRPFGRLLSPQDIAAAALYFASDESALVNGSVLVVEQLPVN
jgi:NAD(P)-dependent dehydrogenase (short-subunit alcohol dehydrogenase family)